MADVRLNYDEKAERLLIEGHIQELSSNPLVAAFMRKHHGISLSDSCIEIPCAEENLSNLYRSLGKVFKVYGVEIDEAPPLSGAINEIQNAELEFAEFARRAELIWNRELDTDEFKDFVKVLENRCAGRVFYRRQLLSAYHLAFSQNSCNFSVPGAGKTSIVYAAYAYLNSLPNDEPKFVNHLLIVGPLSCFKAWESEFQEIFERPAESKRISGGVPAQERLGYLRGIEYGSASTEVTLTSYQTLFAAEDEFARFMRSPDRRIMMVLDEAHHIKRDDGQWASAVLSLAPLAYSRVVLTGTPAPNGYEDLGNLFKFLYPDRRIIGFPSGTLRAMSTGAMPDAVEKLKDNIRPFYTRVRKGDLDLPPFEEQRIEVSLSEAHRNIYDGIERLIVPRLRDDSDFPTSTLIRARLIRLRQAATNPALLLMPLEDEGVIGGADFESFTASERDIASWVRQFDASLQLEKLRKASEIVRGIIEDEGKLVIWSVFIGNLHLLRQHLNDYAEFVGLISGATPVADNESTDWNDLSTREAIIDRFHRENETSILIANPQAVGESISLHKVCDTALYFDRDFNAGRYIQSKDRIHRYDPNPQRSKRYIYLIAENTVDGVIDIRLDWKEQRMAALIDSEEIPLFDYSIDEDESLDDIRAIIRAYEQRKAL